MLQRMTERQENFSLGLVKLGRGICGQGDGPRTRLPGPAPTGMQMPRPYKRIRQNLRRIIQRTEV